MTQPIDANLLGELLDRHGAALALYARQWTDAADDCVQEALVELAAQPGPIDNPAAWLYRVVRHRALNQARGERRRRDRQRTIALRKTADQQRTPNETERQADALDAIIVLERLDAAARELVVLRIWGQFGWQEIAEVVGGSKSAAQRNYVAALEQLRLTWETDSNRTKPCRTNEKK